MRNQDFLTATNESMIAFVLNADKVIAANVAALNAETCPIKRRGLAIRIEANREYRFMYAKELELRGICL